MRVLVIEDDRKIASFIVNGLKQSGFAVDHASDGEEGLALALTDRRTIKAHARTVYRCVLGVTPVPPVQRRDRGLNAHHPA